MATDSHIYHEIDNKTNLRDVFLKIRKDINHVNSRSALTELYRRAGYLITLSYTPAWQEKFGEGIDAIRNVAKDEFRTTARQVNAKAIQIGTVADYDECWGKMKEEENENDRNM